MPEVSPKMAAVLEKLPADDYAAAQQVLGEVISGGPKAVRELIVAVGEKFGDPAGAKPKYAVHGVVMYAGRPGAEAERKMVAAALAEELQADHSDELKAFVCRQLQLCGGDAEVPALAALLESDRLCEPAAQALQAIGGDAAAKALEAAQSKATGGRKATLDLAVEFVSRK
jgi:hypothetical protein